MESDFSFGVIPLRQVKGQWQLLLIQHRTGGHWAFPKGHAEDDEKPREAAERELREETGLTVIKWLSSDSFTERYQFHRYGQVVDKTVLYFLAEVDDRNLVLQEGEVVNSQWVSVSEASRHVTFPAAKSLCDQVQALLL